VNIVESRYRKEKDVSPRHRTAVSLWISTMFLIGITITSCAKPLIDCVCEIDGTVYELEFKKLERCTAEGGTAICVEE
jgi:hypothetical protein